MNNNDIEEDIKKLDKFCEYEDSVVLVDDELFDLQYAIENVVADRERLLVEKEIQEENYKNLSADVSCIAKELDLEEDVTIDEIYTAIRILKSKRTDMFKYINKANKYNSLVERIKEIRDSLEKDGFVGYADELMDILEEE